MIGVKRFSNLGNYVICTLQQSNILSYYGFLKLQ